MSAPVFAPLSSLIAMHHWKLIRQSLGTIMEGMYHEVNTIPANLSVSLSLDALSHVSVKSTNYLAVHDSEKVSFISMQSGVFSTKEITFEQTANDDNRNFIQHAKLVILHGKVFLVVVSSRTIKVYAEANDLQLIFSHGLSSENKLGQIVHSIHAINKSIFAVGTESKVHFFVANNNGANIKMKDLQHEFKSNARSKIHNFTTNGNGLCAVVEAGVSNTETPNLITVWKFDESKNQFGEVKQIAVHLNTKATGLQLFGNLIVLVTISGQIQLISFTSGQLLSEIHAHVRCITAFDIAQKSGLLVTTSEDSHLMVFRIEALEEDKCKIEHLYQTTVANEMVCGVKFFNETGNMLAYCTYESTHIKVLEKAEAN